MSIKVYKDNLSSRVLISNIDITIAAIENLDGIEVHRTHPSGPALVFNSIRAVISEDDAQTLIANGAKEVN